MAESGLSVKLIIRGAAAAPKATQIQMQLSITNHQGGTVNGTLSLALKEVISNDMISPIQNSQDISIPSSGVTQNLNFGDWFKTPKTGAYLVTATVNGYASNALPIKILL